jgi:carboxypeptidase C (cathepsin A)
MWTMPGLFAQDSRRDGYTTDLTKERTAMMQAAKIASVFILIFGVTILQGPAQQKDKPEQTKNEGASVQGKAGEAAPHHPLSQPDSVTESMVTVGGQKIAYRAVAGTITVGNSDSYDAMLGLDGQLVPDSGMNPPDPAKPEDAPATARMFYAAYFKKDAGEGTRPVMFFYNGGPGSSTLWLHMGSFGPRRVVTPEAEHQPAAPYAIVDNEYSLLDVTDVVFIDAPGTGFSRIQGKDKEKAFWGVDQDAHAFERFIRRFLTKYDRWNSPKYLFGESYGTPRSAVLSALLQSVDLNGIVLLSACLSYDNGVDGPRWNPGVDQPYAVALPTYAATAFYHHKFPVQPPALEPFLTEVEKFALGEYEAALLAGSLLTEAQQQAIAEKLHDYTGLPVSYLLKSNLRVSGGAFSKTLQDPDGVTTGRIDTRYRGPDLDRLSEEAEYDPLMNAISAAYTAAINQYLRMDLKYGKDQTYLPVVWGDGKFTWDILHRAPGAPPVDQGEGSLNTMPDLAYAMKMNPKMHILVAGGYFDLATPFFEGIYEMHHLQIPQRLQDNISYKYYESGHMVYVRDSVLKQFHNDVASFVRDTAAGK